MRVKIVSGNQTGQVRDLPLVEAQIALATGYAVAVPEEPKEGVVEGSLGDVKPFEFERVESPRESESLRDSEPPLREPVQPEP